MKVYPDHWPIVQVNDPGIRPAGKPDHCFYCLAKVGEPHGPQCVIVTKRVSYEVVFLGQVVGRWSRNEPYFWTEADCEFARNEGTWCASSALEDIVWLDTATARVCRSECDPDDCVCNLLTFRFTSVDNPGPQVVDDRQPALTP